MSSIKSFIALVLTAFLVVSCAPQPPEAGTVIAAPGPDLAKINAQNNSVQRAEAKAKERAAKKKAAAEKRRRDIARKAKQRREEIAKKKTTFEAPSYREPIVEKPKKVKPKFPTARKIPGKTGFVFNPYTYEPVDVRGIPSGSTVIDPNDPDKATHRFKVP